MEPEISTTLFSPDGDGTDDQLIFFPRTVHGESCREWEYVIRDRRGALLKTWSGRGTPPESIVWYGFSESGELVFSASDYFYSFTAVDILGNRFASEGDFSTDIFIQIIDGKRKILIPDFVFPAQSADISVLPPEEQEKDMDIVSRLSRMQDTDRGPCQHGQLGGGGGGASSPFAFPGRKSKGPPGNAGN